MLSILSAAATAVDWSKVADGIGEIGELRYRVADPVDVGAARLVA
ncbi:hypothetical protein [Nocardia suismassiliense]|nr:hypothetical protein [Nocardia suismassiliense]